MSFDLLALLKWIAFAGVMFFVWAYVLIWTMFDPGGGVFGIVFALALSVGGFFYLRNPGRL